MLQKIFFHKKGDYKFIAVRFGQNIFTDELLEALFFEEKKELDDWMQNQISKNLLKKFHIFSLSKVI